MEIKKWRTALANVAHVVLHTMYVFPIKKNRVFMVPGNGRYYCNLKAIDEYIRCNNIPLEVVWACKQTNDASYPTDALRVIRHRFSFLYHFYTSKFIIFNNGLPTGLLKKRGQIFINTWHGVPYKKMDTIFLNNPKLGQKERRYYIFNRIDYVISACRKFTESFQEDVGISTTYLSIGTPRNDIFFNRIKTQEKSSLVREKYGVPEDVGIVLYAPTFRDHGMKSNLDEKCFLDALEKRFHKKFVLFLRSHPHTGKDIFLSNTGREGIFDVSDYADMQELLCASDILLTDYSSSMWDFSFTGRPCFIFAEDIESYKKERNFHIPIEEWPFPVAENNAELQRCIAEFDEGIYVAGIRKHQEVLGSYETGAASQQLCDLLMDFCR